MRNDVRLESQVSRYASKGLGFLATEASSEPNMPPATQRSKTTAAEKIRVLSVDDHPLLHEGLAMVIKGQPDMALAAEASSGREAIQQFRLHQPHVTLMDLRLPGIDGIAATKMIIACSQASF